MHMPAIGLICPFWLPLWGGAEQYHFRLASKLQERGFPVKVFCGVAEAENRENGNLSVERYAPSRNIRPGWWGRALHTRADEDFGTISDHYEFMSEAVRWAKSTGVRIALIGNPFNDPRLFHAREMYRRLQDINIKVGLVHHDLSSEIGTNLRKVYFNGKCDWNTATKMVATSLNRLAEKGPHLKWTAMAGSPLFFEPDFFISNSDWATQFIDPLDKCPKITLHPPMDHDFWQSESGSPPTLTKVDVLMVNPQNRKNPKLMKEIIERSPDSTTFRILKGGWGDSFSIFRQLIEPLPQQKKAQIDFVEYVDDMRDAYRSSRVLVFPSFEEGYGMTPVEAMYCGLPVVSSDYPAIGEAVGDAAHTLCPYRTTAEDWIAAIEHALDNEEMWQNRSLQRSHILEQRQEEEFTQLCEFLSGICH